ncbi:MAG: glycosyltransferase family 39 protein [Anaerolineae bacterium]|nr:glycosyltransferase family 39 protein [Anaerolineae bacterium]
MNPLLGWLSSLWSDSTRRALWKITPLLLILLAAYLRFYQIDHQSLWNDEGNSLRLAQRTVPDLIATSRLDIHPPGYYLLLKGWISLVGESELALRSLSAFAGVLTVVCVYALGKQLFAKGVGIMAALLVTINTFSIYYAQETRMYAWLTLFAAASMLAFVRWMERPRWRRVLPLALINAAGLYTQYVFPFVMLTQGVMLVVRLAVHQNGTPRTRLVLRYVALNLLTIALFLPQLGDAWRQVSQWPRTGEAVEFATGAGTLIQWLTLGKTAVNVSWWLYLLLGLFAVASLLPDWLTLRLPSWWRRSLPFVWIAISVLPFFALGLFREANLKFLLPVQIAVALIIGRGLWLLWQLGSPNLFILTEALPRIVAGIGLLGLFSVTTEALPALYNDPRYARPDYRTMAQFISSAPQADDVILLDAPNQEEVFRYYYHGSAPIYPIPRGLGGDDAATIKEVTDVITQHRRLFVLYWGESERDPNRVVEKTLTEQTYEIASPRFGDVRFVQYATPPTSLMPLDLPPTHFGEAITLEKAEISATSLHPGDVLALSLTWQTDRPLDKRYKVFIHVLDSNGGILTQRDSEPGNYLAITTTWQPDMPVIDTHGLVIPLTASAGTYRVIIGLYDSGDPLQRLPIGQSDTLVLTTISVS